MSQKPAPTKPEPDGPAWQRLFPIAVAIVLAYLVFALIAFMRADDGLNEVLWNRSAWVVQGVEAIAFTAVGWLFGREVHRGEAAAAKEQASAAQSDAAAARSGEQTAVARAATAEASGVALAESVRAVAAGVEASGAGPTGGDEKGRADRADRELRADEAPAGADYLRSVADRLFPPS